jgi:hypothetical protein
MIFFMYFRTANCNSGAKDTKRRYNFCSIALYTMFTVSCLAEYIRTEANVHSVFI